MLLSDNIVVYTGRLTTTFHLPPDTQNLFSKREAGWNIHISPVVVSFHQFTENERTGAGGRAGVAGTNHPIDGKVFIC
jgi:hypothetical protein